MDKTSTLRGGWLRTDAPVCTLDILPEFTVDQQIGRGTSVFAAYVGTFGRDLARIIGLNLGPGFPQALRPDPRFAEINLQLGGKLTF